MGLTVASISVCACSAPARALGGATMQDMELREEWQDDGFPR